jgi:putative endonuclease
MTEDKPCFVYILQSEINGMFYIGCTNDLQDRLKRHNQGRSKFIKPYRPFKLVYIKEFASKTLAMKYESHLKSFKTREAIQSVIDGVA